MQYYNPHFLIATFFGVGKITKKCPGTLGSLAGIPLAYLMMKFSNMILPYLNIHYAESQLSYFFTPMLLTLVLFLIGSYSSHHYAKMLKKDDPAEIVIDEVLGQTLSILVTVPMTAVIIYQTSAEKDIEKK